MCTKILITGLTLHNNKGGPALALSLIQNIRPVFKNPKFYLSIPDFNNNYKYELKWSKFYKIDGIMRNIVSYDIYSLSALRKYRTKRNKIIEFTRRFKKFDIIIDLTALSYMDLEYFNLRQNIMRNLSIYLNRYFSKKYNIPMIRWTQSFGPFRNYITKFIVKLDLKQQKYILVRGRKSKNNVKSIIKSSNIYSFPDIAITLPFSDRYYTEKIKLKKYITISPSCVLYRVRGLSYLLEISKIISTLSGQYNIILVPHNTMMINPSLLNCDLEICREISKHTEKNVIIIQENLDVFELKGIIAHSYIHIGSRYHSIIAAISTAVPTIAYSWHHKYKDILEYYEIDNFIYNGNNLEHFNNLVTIIEKNYSTIKQNLKLNQLRNLNKIKKNKYLFNKMVPNEMLNMQFTKN